MYQITEPMIAVSVKIIDSFNMFARSVQLVFVYLIQHPDEPTTHQGIADGIAPQHRYNRRTIGKALKKLRALKLVESTKAPHRKTIHRVTGGGVLITPQQTEQQNKPAEAVKPSSGMSCIGSILPAIVLSQGQSGIRSDFEEVFNVRTNGIGNDHAQAMEIMLERYKAGKFSRPMMNPLAYLEKVHQSNQHCTQVHTVESQQHFRPAAAKTSTSILFKMRSDWYSLPDDQRQTYIEIAMQNPHTVNGKRPVNVLAMNAYIQQHPLYTVYQAAVNER